MIENKFFELLENHYYMIGVFDKNDNLIMKNRKFDKYFENVENYQTFATNIIDIESDNSSKRIYVKSPFYDGVIKFEISENDDMLMLTGTSLSYDRLVDILKYVEKSAKTYEVDNESIDFNRNKLRTYCTFMVDDDWNIKYFSENVYALLSLENPYLKTVREVFGEEFFSKIIEKSDLFDMFDDLCIEYSDKLLVVTKSPHGYTILNVYPYSNNVCNRFEEVSNLKYKIEQLESELKRRKKLIDFQKDVIRSLNDRVDKCKCSI